LADYRYERRQVRGGLHHAVRWGSAPGKINLYVPSKLYVY
jgi:hypothetical protein